MAMGVSQTKDVGGQPLNRMPRVPQDLGAHLTDVEGGIGVDEPAAVPRRVLDVQGDDGHVGPQL